jgi:hypothetical protein
MKLRHYVVDAVLTALAAPGLIAASPAVADPVYPYRCEKEWLLPRPLDMRGPDGWPVAPDKASRARGVRGAGRAWAIRAGWPALEERPFPAVLADSGK